MAGTGLWVFGYGSLIWEPGFDFDDRRLATLHGYRRAFCMTSIVYRGTPEAPGLVLALDGDPEAPAPASPTTSPSPRPPPPSATSASANSSPMPTRKPA